MTPPADPWADPWARALRALELLAIDPAGLGGIWIRARAGLVRDRLLAALAPAMAPRPCRRLRAGIGDEALFGGIDHLATLSAGRLVRDRGLAGEAPLALILPMAERAEAGLAARLALLLEAGHCLVALDEGAGPDEELAPSLAERLALRLDLDGLPAAACPEPSLDPVALATARQHLPGVRAPAEAATDLTLLAARLGIASMRAPWFALRAARAAAAAAGRVEVTADDLALAAALVIGPRAVALAAEDQAEERSEPPADPAPGDPDPGDARPETGPPRDVLLDAAKATLPPDLLARLAEGAAAPASRGDGSGARRRGNRRGRPLAARPGRPDGAARIDIVATLRAAAPWQPLRRAAPGAPGRFLAIARSDIHLRRFEDRSDRLLIFTVDASGSAAVARLAEAKGAVELLLATAYARRDHVALIGFRGTGAELLLPPTRSLVQAKRRLATLPGGGGTPLATGLRAALAVAETARGRGLTPTLALITDGRANIALDGAADRTAAAEDAARLARAFRALRIPSLVIDMGGRPTSALAQLAAAMRATYQPLPRADARRIAASVDTALTTGP